VRYIYIYLEMEDSLDTHTDLAVIKAREVLVLT